jgi:hypothetical protein
VSPQDDDILAANLHGCSSPQIGFAIEFALLTLPGRTRNRQTNVD